MGSENSTASVSPSEVDFKINVNASTDSNESFIDAQGSVDAPVYQNDLELFQIGDLRSAAAKLPRDAFLDGYMLIRVFTRGGTPERHHQLFVVEKWRLIKKTIRPVKTEVVKLVTEAVIIANRKFVNSSKVRAKYNVGVTHEEQHTVTTTWSSKIDLNVDLKIEYQLQAQSTADISFQSSWGKDFHQSKTITIGSQTGVEVELEPCQEVVARLRVTRYTMDVKVTFEISLEGDIGCKYESFWNMFTPHELKADINDILRAGNLPTVVTTSEVLKISFCTDGDILISDS